MGLGKVEVRNQEAGLPPKGTYGRHSAFRDGDCFRGLVSRCESATGTAKDVTRIEGF